MLSESQQPKMIANGQVIKRCSRCLEEQTAALGVEEVLLYRQTADLFNYSLMSPESVIIEPVEMPHKAERL